MADMTKTTNMTMCIVATGEQTMEGVSTTQLRATSLSASQDDPSPDITSAKTPVRGYSPSLRTPLISSHLHLHSSSLIPAVHASNTRLPDLTTTLQL